MLFRRGEVGAKAECFVSPFQRAFWDPKQVSLSFRVGCIGQHDWMMVLASPIGQHDWMMVLASPIGHSGPFIIPSSLFT